MTDAGEAPNQKTQSIKMDFKKYSLGRLGAQQDKASAFSPGHDPRVLGSSPASGFLLSREPASSSLSAYLSSLSVK